MIHELRLFFVALQFLTRVPVPRWVGFDPAWLQACLRHFPAVGACIGAVAAAVLWAALQGWPPTVAAALSLAATVWLTGAFHEDGLADTCDGLGGAVSRERSLAIMKDSRIGSYGAVALVLALGLKVALVATLAQRSVGLAMLALVWSHAASRAAPVWLVWRLPYAGDAEHAKAKPLATQVGGAGLVVAGAWVLVLSLAVLAWAAWAAPSGLSGWGADSGVDSGVDPGVVLGAVGAGGAHAAVEAVARQVALALAAVAVATLWCTAWLRRRLGGFTGDTLGATQQITELASLLAWAAAVGAGVGMAHG
jgi:adenosylcobinamide-GDP ribazoletransferase